jgi:hypothetical protein
MDRSVSRSNRFASAEVSRSSHKCTGSRKRFLSSSANSCIFADCVPSAPLMRNGKPTTSSLTAYSRINFSKAAKSVRLLRRSRVSSPCAVMPNASERASPILREPTSSPKTRPIGCPEPASGGITSRIISVQDNRCSEDNASTAIFSWGYATRHCLAFSVILG